jgi:hypothetical protein
VFSAPTCYQVKFTDISESSVFKGIGLLVFGGLPLDADAAEIEHLKQYVPGKANLFSTPKSLVKSIICPNYNRDRTAKVFNSR